MSKDYRGGLYTPAATPGSTLAALMGLPTDVMLDIQSIAALAANVGVITIVKGTTNGENQTLAAGRYLVPGVVRAGSMTLFGDGSVDKISVVATTVDGKEFSRYNS